MFSNYLTSVLRALQRDKFHTVLNASGLTIALTITFLVALYVRYEFTYESFFTDSDRIFLVQMNYQFKDGRERTMSPVKLADRSGLDLPDQPRITYLFPSYSESRLIDAGGVVVSQGATIVDENFFDVLDFPLAFGSYSDLISEPGKAALTESFAEQLFGQTDVVGQNLLIHGATYQIAAILKDIPRNSRLFNTKVLLSSGASANMVLSAALLEDWKVTAGLAFIRLQESVDTEMVETRLESWLEQYIPNEDKETLISFSFSLTRMDRFHLTTSGNENLHRIYTLGAMALLLILIAGFNYINLSTARTLLRTKEVSMRRILGAKKFQIVAQFQGETLLTTLLSFTLAMGLAVVLLPIFSILVDRPLDVVELVSPAYLLAAFSLALVVGLLSGTYPAFMLASTRPNEVFNNQQVATGSHSSLRSSLVGVQFSMALCLIIAAMVTFAQTTYLQSLDLGFRKQGILVINDMPTGESSGLREVYNRRLLDSPFIEQVASSDRTPSAVLAPTSTLYLNQFDSVNVKQVRILEVPADEEFFDLYGINAVAGRLFSSSMGDAMLAPSEDISDMPASWLSNGNFVHRGGRIVLSELAVREFGFDSPTEAIGQSLSGLATVSTEGILLTTGVQQANANANGTLKISVLQYEVVGVVPDVLFTLGRKSQEPTVYFYRSAEFTDDLNTTSARVAPNGAAGAAAHAEQVWREMFPDKQFTYDFLEDRVETANAEEKRQSQIFISLTGLAILVTCLGLFGLVSFAAACRTREVAIRKVLGAKTRDVTRMLVWEFAKPILLANLIAWPVAWVFMRHWLDGFPYRIELSPWFFIGASVLALTVALLTVIGRTWKAAQTRPAQALKYE